MNIFINMFLTMMLGSLGHFALALTLLFYVCSSYADQKYLTFTVSSQVTTDDNFSLSSKPQEIEVHTGRLNLSSELGRAHELGTEKLETKVSGRKYLGDSEGIKSFPAFDVRATSSRRLSDVLEVDLEGAYSRTRTSADEFEQLGNLLLVDEKGQDKDKVVWNLRTGLVWSLTEYWSVGVNSSLERLRFNANETTQLLNYQYFTNAVTIRRYLASNLHSYLQLSYSDFDARPEETAIQQLNAVDSVTKGGVAGLAWDFDERSRLDVSYGVRQSDFKPEIAQESEERGRQGSLSYRFRSELYVLRANANESLLPRSDGALVINRAAEAEVDMATGERSTLSFKAKREAEESQGRLNETSENYAEYTVLGSYRVRHDLRCSAGVKHRRSLGGARKAGNSVNLSLTWSPDRYQF